MFPNILKTFIIIIALVAVILFLVLPIKLPYNIKVLGKVVPARSWTLSIKDGQVETSLTNNKSGMNEAYFVSQTERADVLKLAMNKNLENTTYVAENDTIGNIFSNEINRQLAQMVGNLEQARASLTSNITGDKKSIIKAAQEQLAYARKKSEEQKKIFARLDALHEKKMVSDEEYEIAKSESELNDINIAIANAQLDRALTGAKPEDIELIRTRISSLEKEVQIMRKRQQSFTLISPIGGAINHISGSDTVLIVSDTSEYVINMPVELSDRKYIRTGETIDLKLPHENEIISARVLLVDNKVQVLMGNQVILVKGLAGNETSRLLPGMYLNCSIGCGNFTVGQHLKRILTEMFN